MGAGIAMIEIVIYSKPECHLCDSAKYVIEKAGERFELDIREVDISVAGHEALFERYKHDIPVVFVNREERFRWRVDPGELATLLKSLAG